MDKVWGFILVSESMREAIGGRAPIFVGAAPALDVGFHKMFNMECVNRSRRNINRIFYPFGGESLDSNN